MRRKPINIMKRVFRNQIRDILRFNFALPVFHDIRTEIPTAALTDGIPFFKSLLRRHAVPQMPFAAECTGIAALLQELGISRKVRDILLRRHGLALKFLPRQIPL